MKKYNELIQMTRKTGVWSGTGYNVNILTPLKHNGYMYVVTSLYANEDGVSVRMRRNGKDYIKTVFDDECYIVNKLHGILDKMIKQLNMR